LVRFLESPTIQVESTPMNSDSPVSLYQWIILGSVPDLEAAMNSLKIAPGAHNGEDITVVVIAASEETAQGDNEIAVREVEVVRSFIIPVDPVSKKVMTCALIFSEHDNNAVSTHPLLVDMTGYLRHSSPPSPSFRKWIRG
jgi:hypothetical protein